MVRQYKPKLKVSDNLIAVYNDLSLLDKLLPLLIICCIVLGIIISVYVPSSREAFHKASILNVSFPLAIGLIVMMVPPLCKVEWENFKQFFNLKLYLQPILISIIINWVICPFIMFGLAWLTLFDQKEYREGIIMIGLARCIAMVLLWNEIADGDNTLCAILVLINSLLQIVLYAPYQIFLCYAITGDYNLSVNAGVTYTAVARSVAFFLGVPLVIGLALRLFGVFVTGLKFYESKMLPIIGPFSMLGLLYTIIVIFIEKGDSFIDEIGTSIRCFVPLVVYFPLTFFACFFFVRWFTSKYRVDVEEDEGAEETSKLLCGCEQEKESNPEKWSSNCSAYYASTVTQSFTAASNNFELSIAVAISLYGNGSRQAIASTYGPLLEVPILLILCFVAKYFKVKFIWADIKD